MTRRVALIGHPLKRQHSEIMHNAAFREFSIDARYELHDLRADEVSVFAGAARDEKWLGFQVTTPYKLLVMDHLDEIENGARAIGAVNSVVRKNDGTLVGFNSDAPGFRRAAESELGIQLSGVRAAVAGAGGAARAVVHALATAGASDIAVANRDGQRAVDLAGDFDTSVQAVTVGAEFDAALRLADLAVNATTVGMVDPGVAFDPAVLQDSAAVYDLVYSPEESELLCQARRRGLLTANGMGMLVAQAEIAFERWTGVADSGPIMRAALNDFVREGT